MQKRIKMPSKYHLYEIWQMKSSHQRIESTHWKNPYILRCSNPVKKVNNMDDQMFRIHWKNQKNQSIELSEWDTCDPDFGRAHDFVLHKFGQQIPPMVEHSLSCKHFGVHDAIWDDNGHWPKSMRKKQTNIHLYRYCDRRKYTSFIIDAAALIKYHTYWLHQSWRIMSWSVPTNKSIWLIERKENINKKYRRFRQNNWIDRKVF